MSALLSGTLADLGPVRPLTPAGRARLDEVFGIGNDARATRLLQISIREVDGTPVYASFGGIADYNDEEEFRQAAAGTVVASVQDLEVAAVGPFGPHRLSVLKIHTPLLRSGSGEVFAVAELYYSAGAILALQRQAQTEVWLLMAYAGIAVVGILYLFVAQAGRTITHQRKDLARKLSESRQLSQQVTALHRDSERLRLEATLSNERLLAQVGSELHDGPLQLLTLVILRLAKRADETQSQRTKSGLLKTVELAAEAHEEIRNISSGLVLPELEKLSLSEVIELAISRHEGATGTTVRCKIGTGDAPAAMAAKICAYRVIQEALHNAFWHGDGAEPAVVATVAGQACRIAVSNGTGGPQASKGAPPREHHLGIKSMRFRVQSLGGTLRVSRRPGARITVSASIPLQARDSGLLR
jgi:signal transduction histidine kinase